MVAPFHPREDARLRKLEECEILDTPPEEVFDRIAHMAGQICNCPIAAVNLIDRERQWFKAAIGTKLRTTTRDIAFCAHTVAGGTPIVVDDCSRDARFRDYPLVVGERSAASPEKWRRSSSCDERFCGVSDWKSSDYSLVAWSCTTCAGRSPSRSAAPNA